MKQIIVQKYGGTSVGSIDRIKKVAKKIIDTKNKGYKVIVVVSAIGDSTNELLEKAKAISPNPPDRELDMLLATGEQVSIALLAMAIRELNHDVISLTGPQCGIITNSTHNKARIIKINTDRLDSELSMNKIVIVAGFQGYCMEKDITTLGRGGSDTTAVAIASAINACKCEIYTDVDGVYTADPRIVSNAKLLNKISYDEMLELASLGAKVLHPRSVELARKFNIPLIVKSSFKDSLGTEIVEVNAVEKVSVRGISLDENIAKISVLEVPDKPGVAFKLFSSLAENYIHIDTIIQNINRASVNDISFTVKSNDLQKALKITQEFKNQIGSKTVIYDESVSKLSIVGTGIAGNSYVASTFFKALYELGINIQMISTSEIKISCIISQKNSQKAFQYVHDKFNLDRE